MNTIEIIVTVASALTAITVIITNIVAVYRFIRKEEKRREVKDKHDLENYLSILRLTIVSDEMPITERISAGDKYLKLGGNGAVKKLYKSLLENYEIQ